VSRNFLVPDHCISWAHLNFFRDGESELDSFEYPESIPTDSTSLWNVSNLRRKPMRNILFVELPTDFLLTKSKMIAKKLAKSAKAAANDCHVNKNSSIQSLSLNRDYPVAPADAAPESLA